MEWNSQKASLGFMPQVTIVRQSFKELPRESQLLIEKEEMEEPQTEPQTEPDPAAQFYHEWAEDKEKIREYDTHTHMDFTACICTTANVTLGPETMRRMC